MSAAAAQPAQANTLMDVRVIAANRVARETSVYRFVRTDGKPVPSATAGSHVDVHLPNGLIRQYSLILSPTTSAEYAIGVKLDSPSRGGSTYIHSHFQVGSTFKVSAPRNHFPLDEDAAHSVLIAGGIGITPIFSMLRRLIDLKKPWQLFYACRSRADTAFLDFLQARPEARLHFDDENQGGHLDLNAIIAQAPPGSHYYCCGPLPMMSAFEKASAATDPGRIHVEYFSPKQEASLQGAFTVRLARSDKTLHVPEGQSILEVVEKAGIAVEHSCTEGICGTCETRVIEGVPEHRDSILSPAERASNKTMMICCSRAKTKELVLDL